VLEIPHKHQQHQHRVSTSSWGIHSVEWRVTGTISASWVHAMGGHIGLLVVPMPHPTPTVLVRKTISLCKRWSHQNGQKVKSWGQGCSSQSSDKKYWLRAALKHVMLFYFTDFLFGLWLKNIFGCNFSKNAFICLCHNLSGLWIMLEDTLLCEQYWKVPRSLIWKTPWDWADEIFCPDYCSLAASYQTICILISDLK